MGRAQRQVGCGGAGGSIGTDSYVGNGSILFRSRTVARKRDGFGSGPAQSDSVCTIVRLLLDSQLVLG